MTNVEQPAADRPKAKKLTPTEVRRDELARILSITPAAAVQRIEGLIQQFSQTSEADADEARQIVLELDAIMLAALCANGPAEAVRVMYQQHSRTAPGVPAVLDAAVPTDHPDLLAAAKSDPKTPPDESDEVTE